MKKRIAEIEESNEIAVLALSRTRTSIRRLRLEYAILLERLEGRVYNYQGSDAADLVVAPGSPALLDETLNLRLAKLGNTKADKSGAEKGDRSEKARAATRKAVKDPNLPKRPASAYVLFCELERDKLRAEFEALNPGKPATEFTKHLVELWKNLDPEQKAPFNKAHEDEKERYAREMLAYTERKASEATETPRSDTVDASEPAESAEAEGATEGADNEAANEHMDVEGESRPSVEVKDEPAEASGSGAASEGQKEDEAEQATTLAPIKEEASASVAPSSPVEAEQPPAKKPKYEATRTVASGSNGQPKITIKFRSPSAPQP